MGKLAPSILSADFNILGEQIKQIENAGVEYLHIDVMDGVFVPNISFGIPVVRSIRKNSNMYFDVHLMITEPVRYVNAFKMAGADSFTFHYEACSDIATVGSTITAAKEVGMKVGISIKPGTPVSVLEPYLEFIDVVLIMSVEPGFGGQRFHETTYDKVKELKKMIIDNNVDVKIEIDGGVDEKNATKLLDCGADILVVGSAFFKKGIDNALEIFMPMIEG